MSMIEPLKPCPLCGREPQLRDHAASGVENDWIWFAYCSCGGYITRVHKSAFSPEELASLWNTRPIEDALQARIAELEAQLEAAREDTARLDAMDRLHDDAPWADEYPNLRAAIDAALNSLT